MHTRRMLLCVPVFALMAVGCAKESGYSLDLRNISGQMVRLDLVAKAKDASPTVVGTSRLGTGASTTMYTKADRNAAVSLEARVDGDTTSPPAVMPVTLGPTQVDILNPTEKQAKDPAAPKLRLRERS